MPAQGPSTIRLVHSHSQQPNSSNPENNRNGYTQKSIGDVQGRIINDCLQ
jgi:hypothetical protein